LSSDPKDYLGRKRSDEKTLRFKFSIQQLLEGLRRNTGLAKKARRSIRNAGAATKNFGKWLPKASKHFVEELPPATRRFRSWVVTYKGILTMVCLIGIVLLPMIIPNEFYLGLFVTADIWVIYAASWDFLAGYAGQVSFGHAAFLGIAGYASAGLVRYFGQPWWVSVFAGAFMAVALGLIVGIPCLKFRGPYLALGTLAFSLILVNIFESPALQPWLGASGGVSGVPPLSYDPILEYLVVLGFMLFALVVMISIANSRVGTVFKSIRDDETSAEASGINTTKYKLVAFMISAFFAGIAGSLFALHNRGVSPPVFSTLYSFEAIVMAALGGIATIVGSLGGAYLFTFLDNFLSSFANFSLFLFAVVLIIVFRFASGGFVKPLVDKLREFINILRGK
jgi:branched-chain amino acid transport system permease protein